MDHIGKHLESKKKRDQATERGELMRYFVERLNRSRVRDGLPSLTMGRMARVLMAMPTQDIYYLKSVCDDAEARNGVSAFSKKFWWEVNPKKHPEDRVVIKKPKKND